LGESSLLSPWKVLEFDDSAFLSTITSLFYGQYDTTESVDGGIEGLPVAQGGRAVAGSIPGLLPLLAKCGGVPEQDTT